MNELPRPVVLVVDRDAVSLTAMAAILHCHNYEVHCAQDIEAAARGLRLLDVDLIVYDESIDADHETRLRTILAAAPEKDDVPVLFISSRQLPDIVNRPTVRGAAYHLRKPMDPKMLVDFVDRALWQLPLINRRLADCRQRDIPAPHFAVKSGSAVEVPQNVM